MMRYGSTTLKSAVHGDFGHLQATFIGESVLRLRRENARKAVLSEGFRTGVPMLAIEFPLGGPAASPLGTP